MKWGKKADPYERMPKIFGKANYLESDYKSPFFKVDIEV